MGSRTSSTTEAIRAISKDYCLTALKDFGFRRRSPHLFRETPALIHAVHFQASQWGDNDKGSFTINLCVVEERLFQFWTGKELPKNPATAGWPIQVRLGKICGEAQDLWWDIDSSVDIATLGADVSRRLVERAVPYFDRFQTLRDIQDAIVKNSLPTGIFDAQKPLIEAMILVCEGQGREANRIIETQKTIWQGKPFYDTVITIEDRLAKQSIG